MAEYKFGSIVDRNFRLTLQRLADEVSTQGKTIQDLVAEGQLTPKQYADLMKEINGMVRKGQISINDIDKNKGKLDGTYFTDDFLSNLANGELNVTNLLNRSVTSDKIAEKSVTPLKTDFFEPAQKNLFNGEYIDGILVSVRYHTYLEPVQNYNSFEGKVAEIPIQPNVQYAISVTDNSNIFRIGTHSGMVSFDERGHGNYLDNLELSTSQGDGVYTHTFTSASDARYMYIYVSNDGTEPYLRVVEGESVNDNYHIPQRYLDLKGIQDHIEVDSKFNMPGDFNSLYRQNVIGEYLTNPRDIRADAMHSLFNDLVDAHPDKAERSLLGQDDLGNDIYYYRTKPLQYNEAEYVAGLDGTEGTPLKNPKIMITGTVHGSEKGGSITLYYFLKELLENPQNKEENDIILSNVEFVILPIMNPSGYNAGTYNNTNDANLNREFPLYGEPNEVEAQYAKSVIEDNVDMDYFIDFHNMFPRDGLIGYSLTDDAFFKRSTLNTYKTIGRAWQLEDDSFPQNFDHRWTFTANANDGTVGKYVQTVHGIPSALIEVPRAIPFGETVNYEEPVIRLGMDVLMNTVYACIRNKG